MTSRYHAEFVPAVAVQLAYPASDITVASWISSLGGALYAAIDEPTTPDDTDYIYTNTPGVVAEVALGSLTDPLSSTGHVLRIRARSKEARSGTWYLIQGASVIASWTDTLIAGDVTYTHTLSGAEADSITNYADLRARFVGVVP